MRFVPYRTQGALVQTDAINMSTTTLPLSRQAAVLADPSRSAREAEARLRRVPDDADALFALAEAYGRMERHTEASLAHRTLVRRDARFADLSAPDSEPAPTGFIGRFDPVPCPVCESDDSVPVWVGNISKNVRTWGHLDPIRAWVCCNDCETVRVAEPPSAAALARWGRAQSHHKAASPPPSTAELSQELLRRDPEIDHIERMGFGTAWLDLLEAPKPRLLEVGSGWGGFLAAATWRGFSVTGVTSAEPATWAARHLGVPTVVEPAGPPTSEHIPDGVFDTIVLRDVMDRSADPTELLQTVARRLAPGGLLVIEIALRDHPVQRMRGHDDPRWSAPDRRVFFSRATLDVVLARAGFRSIAVRHPSNPEPGTALVFARRDDMHERLLTE